MQLFLDVSPDYTISLGLFLKFYQLLLNDCEDLDLKIAVNIQLKLVPQPGTQTLINM